MDRYEEYKDSGVDWIGEIPAGWEVRRISSLYEARNEKVSDRDYPPLSVTMQGIVPQLETAAKTQDGENRKLVKSGDFAINSRSDRRGACGISAYDGSVTLITNVLAPKDQASMNPRYYSHLFRSEGFADEYYRQGTGIVDDLWSTNWTRMKNILVACPSLVEQASIAEYLDAKTTEIDSLVEDCEREVELLREYRKAVISEAVTKGLDPNAPMKDSGIDWIGKTPEGWQVAQLGRLCETRNGLDYDATQVCGASDEGSVLVIRSGNVSSGQLVLDDCLYIRKEVPDQLLLRKGDVVIVRTNGSKELVGKSALVKTDGVGTLGAFMLLCRSRFGRYINWLLQSTMLTNYMGAFSTSTVNQLSNGVLRRIHVPFPAEAVQEEICNYLDAKTAEIDSLIADYQSMADKLREYRTSLISEAVTGKFKVPGVA